jgi:Zn-dependent protease with chaperone function
VRKLLLSLAAVAVATAVVVTIAAQPRPEPKKQDDERFEVKVTGEMLRHTRLVHTLYFVGVAYTTGVLLVILLTGLSRRMRDAAARVTKRPFVTSFLYLTMFAIAATILEFPLSYYSGFVVPHQFALTHQTFGAWLIDSLKELAITIVVGGLLGSLALWTLRHMRRWWLAIWLGAIPVSIALVMLQPLVFDPLFNDFQPLRDPRLRADLLALASRAGIEGSDVYEVDRSKQTTTMNAYVNGIGPTTRIVMWDTLLAKMSHDEVLTVMGHEMGHYVMRHIWQGTAFGLAIGLPLIWLGHVVHDSGLARWGATWGVKGAGDPAEVPWLLLILTIGTFLVTPIGAAFSRHLEHQADVFSLDLTHKNEAFATAFIKLAEDSKWDPDPPKIIEWWMYSHPTIRERIAFALTYGK